MVRKLVFITSVFLVLLASAGGALAQMKDSSTVVKVAPVKVELTAAPGQRVAMAVNVDIDPTWHLYAHGDTNFIGLDLAPSAFFPLLEFAAEYPHGHEGEFFGEKVEMIAGKNVIQASALVADGMPAGQYPLDFEVTIQACDDKTCLAPANVPVSFTLTVQESAE